jgi:hypothetical protein
MSVIFAKALKDNYNDVCSELISVFISLLFFSWRASRRFVLFIFFLCFYHFFHCGCTRSSSFNYSFLQGLES